MKMPTLESNGIDIYYEIHGSGPPLILIAGVGYGAWFWHKIVPELAEHYQVVVFDNRGAGKSEKPPGPYTVPMMAADTAGLLDTLSLGNVALLGHSLGGFIAQELMVSRPELVGKLILASTNHGGMKVVPITQQAMEVLTNREGDPLELVRRGIEIACAPGFIERQMEIVQELVNYRLSNPVPLPQYQAQVAAGAGMATLSEEEVQERMAAIEVPTLVLFGEFDRVVPPGNAELLTAKIPNAKAKILPGTGHMFPIENPAATVAAIQPFLSS
jgi:pimeloyl-ACP methyl ester carboxylesterase